MFVSFIILLYNSWASILVLSMIIITFAEMVGFPYTNAFAMKRAKAGNEGRYMALYTMAFSLAHIISPKLGLDVVAKYGYQSNFILISLIAFVAILLSVWLKKELAKKMT
jgi:predicted MFS family arabinose efflux permease